jgi:hypothetical protein
MILNQSCNKIMLCIVPSVRTPFVRTGSNDASLLDETHATSKMKISPCLKHTTVILSERPKKSFTAGR